MCHFLTQWRCATVQHIEQDQIWEVRTTSLVQMTHSYWPLSMSSWIRVGKSAAEDLGRTFGVVFAGFCLGAEVRELPQVMSMNATKPRAGYDI